MGQLYRRVDRGRARVVSHDALYGILDPIIKLKFCILVECFYNVEMNQKMFTFFYYCTYTRTRNVFIL